MPARPLPAGGSSVTAGTEVPTSLAAGEIYVQLDPDDETQAIALYVGEGVASKGDPGDDGRTILSGHGAPSSGQGVDGDFYLDEDSFDFYGPKAAGAWGSATTLVGPQGPAGADGGGGPPSGAAGGVLAGSYPNPTLGDQAVLPHYAADALRISAHRPAGAIADTTDRLGAGASAAITSGTLHLVLARQPLPAGRPISALTFCASAASVTPTHTVFTIHRASDLALLATTVDDGNAAWATNVNQGRKTLQIATSLRGSTPGGTYTPDSDLEVYFGILQVAGTPATLRGTAGNSNLLGIPPVIAGPTASTGLTGPADLPSTAGQITAASAIPYAYAS